MTHPSPNTTRAALWTGALRCVHHIALNVKDMQASRQFYGGLLGLKELTGSEVPETLKDLVESGKVANFVTPDGLILDLFAAPDLEPPHPDPEKSFTRAYHLAFDIAPDQFDQAVAVLQKNDIAIAHGPVTRPTGRGSIFTTPTVSWLKFSVTRLHPFKGCRRARTSYWPAPAAC